MKPNLDSRAVDSRRSASKLGRFEEFLLIAVLVSSSLLPAEWTTLLILVSLVLVAARLPSPGSLNAALPSVLSLLLVLGLLGAALGSPTTVDVLRDVVGLARIGGLIGLGLLFAADGAFVSRAIRSFIVAGVIGALHHLFTLANSSALYAGLRELRTDVGKGSLAEVLALVLVLLWSGPKARALLPQVLRVLCILILTSSVLLYFSRTSLLSFLIIMSGVALLAPRGASRERSNAGKYAALSVLVASTFLVLGPSQVVDPFLLKVQNSVGEVLPRDASTIASIKQNYRAYESYRAVSSFQAGSPLTQMVGYGWGYRVDLIVDTASTTAGAARYSAPVLHNGYLFLLVKVGLLGIAAYVLILFMLLRGALAAAQGSGENALAGRVAAGCCITTVVSTVVIGGLMNPSTFNALTLFMALAAGPFIGGREAIEEPNA